MFSLDTFTADCVAAVGQDPTHRAVHEVMKRAFSDPRAVLAAMGEPSQGGLNPVYQSGTLTIANVIWKPGMMLTPHNHRMWALIGIYSGREDTIYWRRIKGHPQGRIEAASAQALSAGEVLPLGRDIIHSVNNPIPRFTGALHVYGGDFFAAERSEWDPEHLTEHALDMAKVRARFAQ